MITSIIRNIFSNLKNMFLEKFKSSSPSLVVLILVLCQTSFLAAAPALPLPGTYHFYDSAPPPAKRSPDKGKFFCVYITE